MYKVLLFFLIFIAFSCQSDTGSVLRSNVKEQERFLNLLQKVHSRQDAEQQRKQFQRVYLNLAENIIAIESTEYRGHDALLDKASSISEKVQKELTRVYEIEGVKPLLESFQEDAVHELFLFSLRERPEEVLH